MYQHCCPCLDKDSKKMWWGMGVGAKVSFYIAFVTCKSKFKSLLKVESFFKSKGSLNWAYHGKEEPWDNGRERRDEVLCAWDPIINSIINWGN